MKLSKKNKLIIDFMDIIPEFEYSDPLFNLTYRYHSDWNDLIKVVEKIESLDFEVIIFQCHAEIKSHDIDFKTIFGHSDSYYKIESVYNACIKFIKFYNKKKQFKTKTK